MALVELSGQELSRFAERIDPSLVDMDAPNNTVLDAKSSRVLSLPQTLNADETEFVINRDIDGKKEFFGQQPLDDLPIIPIPEPSNFVRGIVAFGASAPQIGGRLMKEQAELAMSEPSSPEEDFGNLSPMGILARPQKALRAILRMTGDDEKLLERSERIIARNQKYMADAGLTRPEQPGLGRFMYDLGNGGGSLLTSLGIAAVTRSPKTASVMFGAMQKSQIYDEARQAGETPERASNISTVAGVVEGSLEMVGLDRFMKAMKGNAAVKRFVSGFAIEATQEASQTAGEAAITNTTGVRNQDAAQIVGDVLYSAALGGVIGGGTNASLGAFVHKEAIDRGLDESTANQMQAYVEKNIDVSKQDVSEFIEKELAPIAADDRSAQEFMTLMQKFSNNVDLVQPESLDPKTRAVFDQYVEMFNQSYTDLHGIADVEKVFYDQAIEDGVEKDQAVAASKLLGARADAASRALGITPREWFDALRLRVRRDDTAEHPIMEEARKFKERLGEKAAPRPVIDRGKPDTIQRALSIREKPVSVLQLIEKLGGISFGMTQQELGNVRQARESIGKSASKSSMASGELRRIFDGKKGNRLGRLLRDDGLGLDEIYRILEGAGYIERDEAIQDQSNDDAVLDLIEREVNEGRVYPLHIEQAIQEYEAADVDLDAEMTRLGITKDSSVDDIAIALAEARDDSSFLESEPARRLAVPEDDILFQGPIDKTDQGDQRVLPGAEKISDRQLAERKMGQAKRSGKEQKPMDIGMFGDDAKQKSLFQRDKGAARGSITFGEHQTLIELFENADPSTLFHELAHLFLRDMRAIAKNSKRPLVKRDYEAVKKWLGMKGDAMTEAQEEKFARGFEAYLREGKAPKPELQSIFDRFREWMSAIYQNVRALKVDINDDVRQVFDRMLGADYSRGEGVIKKKAKQELDDHYEMVASNDEPSTFRRDTHEIFRNAAELAGDAFAPVSTRLGKIDASLKHAVRRFLFEVGMRSQTDRQRAKPLVEAMSKMDQRDYRMLDFALKNRDTKKADELIKKHGLEKEWEAVREMLDEVYNEASDVGLDLEYLQDYFPRLVRLNMAQEYMAAMRGSEMWGEIQAALNEADPKKQFTAEEQAAFVNNFLRGFTSSRINLKRPSFTKERSVDYVDPQFNHYYLPSPEALLAYISAMRHGIELRKLFGQGKDADDSVGAYVAKLIEDGTLDPAHEEKVKKLLRAVANARGTHGFVSWTKNATYIYLMGNPISAITQLQDLAFSLAKNGYYRTIKGAVKSVIGNPLLTKEDLGIENIAQEFENETRSSKSVRAVFRVVGLEWMDNIGKESLVSAAFDRMRAQAKKGNKQFLQQLDEIFDDEAKQVRQDLRDGTLSENVKYLMFSELSDFQPISLAEMPVGYLRGGNMRVLYMLKTYTIKQFDIYRREVFDKIASGEREQVIEGTQMLIRLGVSLMLMGMGTDALKDLLLGRAIDLSQLVMDNILKVMGINKYQFYQAERDGYAKTAMQFFFPPLYAPIDDPVKDIEKISKGKIEPQDARTLSRVPLIGQFYYWWIGGGSEK